MQQALTCSESAWWCYGWWHPLCRWWRPHTGLVQANGEVYQCADAWRASLCQGPPAWSWHGNRIQSGDRCQGCAGRHRPNSRQVCRTLAECCSQTGSHSAFGSLWNIQIRWFCFFFLKLMTQRWPWSTASAPLGVIAVLCSRETCAPLQSTVQWASFLKPQHRYNMGVIPAFIDLIYRHKHDNLLMRDGSWLQYKDMKSRICF